MAVTLDRSAHAAWSAFEAAAEAAGLNVRYVLAREAVEPTFAAAPAERRGPDFMPEPTRHGPARYHPAYARAIVLGSAGRPFWERCHAERERAESPHPLDAFTVREVERLVVELRGADPAAVAVYPFDHPRRTVPFLALLAGTTLAQAGPFGVAVDARVGPWFAWRAAVLTALPVPVALPAAEPPCATCPAPCVTACPVNAVDKGGFRWRDCVDFRVAEPTCQATCLAREACPVGEPFRYGRDQLAYHYGASLRMIRPPGGTP